jgi:hypothetical protein
MQDTTNIDLGCILLARKIIGSEIWKKPTDYLKIWIYILCKVNHSNGYSFNRGENFFNWSDDIRELKGIKIKTVYNCLNFLKSSKQISTEKTTRGMIIKVNNYETYQDISNYKKSNELANTQVSAGKQLGNTRHTINKNDNNKIMKKNNISSFSSEQNFDEFWEAYPRKVEKKKASAKYSALEKAGIAHTDIMQGLHNYLSDIKARNTAIDYIKHPTTWLNNECWTDKYNMPIQTGRIYAPLEV